MFVDRKIIVFFCTANWLWAATKTIDQKVRHVIISYSILSFIVIIYRMEEMDRE